MVVFANTKTGGSNKAGPCQHKPVELRCASCILDSSYFFQSLSVDAKRQLQKHLQLRTFKRRDIIYKEEDQSRYLYILMTGQVKLYRTAHNGKQQIHKLSMVQGDMIGCEDLYLDFHGSTAETLTDVNVCCLKRKDFHAVANANVEISETLLRLMSLNINSYIKHIANLGQKNALERVASYLVHLYETHHCENLQNSLLHDYLSRIELADMLGITQRTLIRSLKKLETDGFIKLSREGFVIVDMEALICISTGCGCECDYYSV